MATAKPTATTKRTSSGKRSKKDDEPEVSRARWAGVALVIAAIVGAVVLAVVSPSDPGTTQQPGAIAVDPSPSPSPTVLDTSVPVAQPSITSPNSGVTRELYVAVTADLPEETEVRKRNLKLYVMRGEEIVGELPKPKTGESVVVEGVSLVPGPNELTAVLKGPGGLGPASDPITVTVDRNIIELVITSPENKHKTYDDTVRVEGTSEVESLVTIHNEANGVEVPITVGSNGEFAATIRLKRTVNRISATATDDAGLPNKATIKVTRLDGRPTVKVTVAPDTLRESGLPTKIKITVQVRDADGEPMAEADVAYSLGGTGRTTATEVGTTNANGRATWNPVVSASSSLSEEVQVGVTVASPASGETTVVNKSVPIN